MLRPLQLATALVRRAQVDGVMYAKSIELTWALDYILLIAAWSYIVLMMVSVRGDDSEGNQNAASGA